MSERKEGKPIASPDDTLEIALSLAAAGWYIFPAKLVPVTRPDGTQAVDKRPLVKWLEGATRDPDVIKVWWGADFTGAWIGVNTNRSGIVVADIDKAKGTDGRDGFKNLKAAGIKLPKTGVSYPTRGGGMHYVYDAPEGNWTIARDTPVPGVDIRAGNGLMIYYGPKLEGKPRLGKAPAWALVANTSTTSGARAADGDVEQWLRRTIPGKPSKTLRKVAKAIGDPHELDHDSLLSAVSELVKHGTERGAGHVFESVRTTYIEGRPDRVRDWDNAAKGSIGRHGLPPATLELTKAQKKAIAERNRPEVIEQRKEERKQEYRVAKNTEAHSAPKAGVRILEDGPLAVELAAAMRTEWAWTKTMGLLRYTGTRWEMAEPHTIVEQVRDRLDAIEIQEHAAAVGRGDNKAIDKARTLLSRNRARAVSDLVLGRLALEQRTPDEHAHLLNTPAGVVDLRTRELLPHDPDLMFTKVTAVGYDPDATLEHVDKLMTALPKGVRSWVQVRMGQAATGRTPEDDKLVLFQGGGENGKSTLLTGAATALGEYAVGVPDRLLMANPGDHPTELTTLMGARMAIIEELPEGRNLNVKRLKDVIGTPVITARRMRQDNISWRSTHSMLLSTNYTPIVAETDHGTWRRLALLVFPYRYVKTAAEIESDRDRLGDPALRQRFENNADAGMLRWLVDGAHAWYAAGERMPPLPKKVAADTQAWRMDADPVLSYVAERLERDEGRAIACIDLADDFNEYITRRGHREWSQQTINARFEGHTSMAGVTRKKVKFGRIIPSRTGFAIKALPPNTQAWAGVRFKLDGEPRLPSEAELDAAALADLEKRVAP